MSNTIIRQRLHLTGRVQGVGFRPLVYRLANHYSLSGWVRNQGGEVWLEVEGRPEAIAAFRQQLLHQAPPPAAPHLQGEQLLPPQGETGFLILPSAVDRADRATLPLDSHLCDNCLRELHDPRDRRYRYPFINCSRCGPRYSLLDTLPYDRANTAMQAFPLCPKCAREYSDPKDRRFHAEPIACPDCGPSLHFHNEQGTIRGNQAALTAAVRLLREGHILALKGVAAYQLMCDARNQAAVTRLRSRKHRPHKPLALMFPEQGGDGLAALGGFALDDAQRALLRSPQRPIVLCRGDDQGTLRVFPDIAPNIAPGLNEIGIMLPASPLHSLLMEDFGGPLVATSANPSGEPVVYEECEAEARLGGIADGFLHHNRPIRQRSDDPVYRPIAGKLRPLRLGRGDAPLELTLPQPIERPTLALGGQMKNTIALAWGERCVLSPHIGELDSPRALQELAHSIEALQRLYGVRAEQAVADAHPGYGYWPWLKGSGLPWQSIYHHHAHASALYGEYPQLNEDMLVFTWDGTGLGPDGSLWGGEALLGHPGSWRHFSTMRPLRLPGGDKAARQPWRCAAALCWEAKLPLPHPPAEAELLQQAWQRGLNSPKTSSVGRLFDAAAALLGLCHTASFEGQAAMTLEACASQGRAQQHQPLPLHLLEDGRWQWDWGPLLDLLTPPTTEPADAAWLFHQTLAQTLVAQAKQAHQQHRIHSIGLCGGVFQNHLLATLSQQALGEHGFEVRMMQQLPCNDAGLAWGQIIESLSANL